MNKVKEVMKVLLLDGSEEDAETIRKLLSDSIKGLKMDCAGTENEFISYLRKTEYDIILSDFVLPGFDGFTALKWATEICPDVPFICVSDSIGETLTVDLLKNGAVDYVLKERLERLPSAVARAIEEAKGKRIRKQTEKQLESQNSLREKEELYRTLYENSTVGIYRTSPDGKILMANPTLVNLLGYSSFDKLAKRNLEESGFEPSYERARFIEMIESKGVLKGLESSWTKHDGEKVFVSESARAIRDENGKTLFYDGIVEDITLRKKAEQALLLKNFVFDASIAANSIADINGIITEANDAFLKLWGYPDKKKVIGRPITSFLKNTEEADIILTALQKKGEWEGDYTALRMDNSTFYAHGLATTINDVKGDCIGYQSSVLDVTERKNQEEALKQSELRFKQISENFGEWIWEVDASGLYIYSSPIVKVILGFEPEELVNKKYFYDLFTPDVRDKLKQDALEAFSKKESFRNFINPNLHKNGRVVILSTSGLPLLDSHGNLIGYRGVDTDITEQQRADEALQQSLSFSKSLLKTIPFGMDIVDESGNVLFLSESFKRIFSVEGIVRKCWELYRDDNKQCDGCPLINGINIGETEALESHGVLGDRIFEINHTGMLYEGKKAMLEIFQDITDRKINEAELISAKEKAEEGDRLKTAFLNNISHEIRTPMNAIVGFSALLSDPGADEQMRKSYIDIIMQSSNHLLSIITDIVDISNIEANLVKITKNELNINSTLKSLCNQFLPVAGEKNIELSCEYGLADTDAICLTDSTKLIQILSNLINNALKFTHTGSVKVGYKLSDHFLEFTVSDTGIGIPYEDHKRIFDRFYQVHYSESRLYEGTGLGLAISRAYVELQGGKIWLTSEIGKGTSFYFTIPYEKSIPFKPAIEKPVVRSFVFSKKRKILVAEDIDSNFKLISYLLAGTNADLVRAHNGKEALEMCKAENDVDLVLMDIKMPVMDGYTATKLIREAGLEIPIIAQTAYADDMDKAIESGCSGFISKPFDRKGLLFKISEFI